VFELVSVTTSVVISDRYAGHNMETWGVQKTKNLFGFGFTKTEPSKNLTSVQTVFRQKLNAICNSKNNFTCIKCADKECFKTLPKQRLAYGF